MPPTEPQTAKKSNGLVITIIVVIIIIGIIFAIVKSSSKTATPTVTTPADTTGTPADTSTSTPSGTPTAALYKDGTYSADGHYTSPGGHQTVHVTLTLSNDIITSATVTSGAVDPESSHYQAEFISGYTPQVVGKDISTLNLTKVSGSSLTPGGFDDALTQIKTQAQA
jgi:hypothetical protein